MKADEILKLERRKCFDFFWDFCNRDENSEGYGLIVDKTSRPHVASIAGSGFALSAIVIGIENNYISYEEGLEHIIKSLKTLAYNVDHKNGFFAHFVEMENGKRFNKCEFSTIDTALCLNGVIVVEEYFKNEEVSNLADLIIKRVDWKWITFERDDQLLFRMAYNPDKDGAYRGNQPTSFIHHWDHFAEQQMMYMQACQDKKLTDDEIRRLNSEFGHPKGSYKGEEFIYSLGGAMFIYQFANGWFPYQKYLDANKIDWFENSKNAIIANRQYCIDVEEFPTLNENVWCLTAGYGPKGYVVAGGPKTLLDIKKRHGDGTVQQYGIVSSLPFLPEITKQSVEYIYNNLPKCFQEYGFTDGMNLEVDWFSDEYLSLDKGISILMIDNYYNDTIWNHYENSKYIKEAIEVLKYEKRS